MTDTRKTTSKMQKPQGESKGGWEMLVEVKAHGGGVVWIEFRRALGVDTEARG